MSSQYSAFVCSVCDSPVGGFRSGKFLRCFGLRTTFICYSKLLWWPDCRKRKNHQSLWRVNFYKIWLGMFALVVVKSPKWCRITVLCESKHRRNYSLITEVSLSDYFQRKLIFELLSRCQRNKNFVLKSFLLLNLWPHFFACIATCKARLSHANKFIFVFNQTHR